MCTCIVRTPEPLLNPQKLAGQCGKLKCCLNYELAGYEEARKRFPDTTTLLKTTQASAVMVASSSGEGPQPKRPTMIRTIVNNTKGLRCILSPYQIPFSTTVFQRPVQRLAHVIKSIWIKEQNAFTKLIAYKTIRPGTGAMITNWRGKRPEGSWGSIPRYLTVPGFLGLACFIPQCGSCNDNTPDDYDDVAQESPIQPKIIPYSAYAPSTRQAF